MANTDIGIIGAGIIGLSTALALTDGGYSVAIVARELPGDDDSQSWASPWAGAVILPHPDARGQDLQIDAFRHYWALAHRDPSSGVQVVDATEYFDDRSDDSTIWYKRLVPQYRRLAANELPAGAKVGFKFKTMTVNPAAYLPWIKRELDLRRVQFIRAEVSSVDEAKALVGAKVVINASGLGALHLSRDQMVVAARGQTMLVESDFNEVVMFQGSHYTYAIPRMYSGGVIVGGVRQEGDFNKQVDESTRTDILDRINRVSPGTFQSVDLSKSVIRDLVGFRPDRTGGYRLEREGDVIHAYGFGGLGYTYSHGAAFRVLELVNSLLGQRPQLSSRI